MAAEHHPTDVLVDELVRTFTGSVATLEAIVAAGLRRGLDPDRAHTPEARRGDATLAYRRRSLEQARAVLAALERDARRATPIIVGQAYRAGVIATDRTVGLDDGIEAGASQRFGRVHVRAVEALAAGMDRALRDAVHRAGENLELVFERADALDGALPASGRVAGVPFIGRRIDDPYRRVALDVVAGGLVNLDTRRQVSAALVEALVREGVTDATTGFVDRRGRRWTLESYAAMVARTTTREATTAATVNRLEETGIDLVTVSRHVHPADECTPYEGRTYSLTGRSTRFERLTVRPPFHPNCAHVLAPAAVADDGGKKVDLLDEYERELEAELTRLRDRDGVGVEEPPAPPAEEAPAPKPKRTKAKTPAEKVRDRIAELRAKVNAEHVDRVRIDEVRRTVINPQQRRRLIRTLHGDVVDYEEEAAGTYSTAEGLREEDRRMLELLETTEPTKEARRMAEAGEVPLDETAVTEIGKAVLKLADTKSAGGGRVKELDRDLVRADRRTASFLAIYQELRAYMDDGPGRELRGVAYGDAKAKAREARGAWLDARREAEELRGRRLELLREDLSAALSAVRDGFGAGVFRDDLPMGVVAGSGLDPESSAATMRDDLREVARFLPREWVELVNADDRLRFIADPGRAFYSGSLRHVHNRPGDRSTLLHELGHFFEVAVAGVRTVERAFYGRRTAKRGRYRPTPAGEPDAPWSFDDLQAEKRLRDVTGNAGFDEHEVTREDRFTHAYVGKWYGGGFYEVLTMALQGLWYDDHNVRPDRLGAGKGDEDLLRFVAGVLATQ